MRTSDASQLEEKNNETILREKQFTEKERKEKKTRKQETTRQEEEARTGKGKNRHTSRP